MSTKDLGRRRAGLGGEPGSSTTGLQSIAWSYVTRMLQAEHGVGPKVHDALKDVGDEGNTDRTHQRMNVLILDEETTRFVSTVASQREVLRLGVYLTERIDAADQAVGNAKEKAESTRLSRHMSAVYFVRPTKDALRRIRLELKAPRFQSYSVYWSNVVSDMRLQDLAEADGKECVRFVKEMFLDYVALDEHHFYIPLGNPWMSFAPSHLDFGASSDMVDRITEGIASVMLSLRHRFQIRYQRSSDLGSRVAASLHQLTYQDQRALYDFGSRDGQQPLLLLLDRTHDPVTPLLSQWTYQAMIHEILGMKDNVVQVRDHSSSTAPEGRYVVSSREDSFFKKNMYLNFGDVGMAVKHLVDTVSADHKSVKDFDSINDIAEFVERLPDATEQQTLTAKHVGIMSALSREVEERSLMTVSGVEQDVCCQASNPTGHYSSVLEIVHNPSVLVYDKARLVLLYAFRYDEEAPQQTSSLFGAIEQSGIDPLLLDTLRYVRKLWSTQSKDLDVFSDKTLSSRFASLAKQHLKGVENVYTQHTPAFMSLIEKAAKGRLPVSEYPFALEQQHQTGDLQQRHSRLILVFILGGSTYEEAKAIADMNSGSSEHSVAGVHVLLGSTGVHNSHSFLQDLGHVRRLEMYKSTHRS